MMHQAIADRGVTETCIVVGAEEYVVESDGQEYNHVDHRLDCPTGLHHYDTAEKDRVAVDDTIQRTYDPTSRVEAEYDPPQDRPLVRGLAWAAGLACIAPRTLRTIASPDGQTVPELRRRAPPGARGRSLR